MKTCTKCGVPKEEGEFGRRPTGKVKSQCFQCEREDMRARRALNPEASREAVRKFDTSHREERMLAARERRKRNPEASRNSVRKSERKDPEKTRRMRIESKRRRRKKDLSFRIKEALSGRHRLALKGDGAKKIGTTIKALGCPAIWFQIHIASLFRPGMTWDNYGTIWQLDHIRPCASFDLNLSEHQKACFHWTNIQPLFSKENRSKSDATPEQSPKEIGSRCCQAFARR